MCKVYVTEWKNPLNQNKSLRTLSHWMQLVSIYGLESFIHRCSCVFLCVILCTWLIFVSLRWVLYEKPNFKGEKIALDEGDIELTSPFLPPEEQQQDGEAEREARKFIIGSIRRAVRVGGSLLFYFFIFFDSFIRHLSFSLVWFFWGLWLNYYDLFYTILSVQYFLSSLQGLKLSTPPHASL